MVYLIPHFGSIGILRPALESILATDQEAVVYIGDDTHNLNLANLQFKHLNQLVIIPGPKSSFAAQINKLMTYVKKEQWVVIMNNDVRLAKDWAATIHEVIANTTPKIGLIASQLLLPRGVIDSAGDAFSEVGLGFKRLRHFKINSNSSKRPVSVSGALMVVRTDLWQQLKGLDEQIGTYFEDVDFGLRAYSLGYQVLYVPEAMAIHRESSNYNRTYINQQTVRNSILVVRKNFQFPLQRVLLNRLRWWWLGYSLLHPTSLIKNRQIIREASSLEIKMSGAKLNHLPYRYQSVSWWQVGRELRQNYHFTTGFW